MRSLSRSTFVVIAALMLGIAFSATSAMAQQSANDAAGRRFSGKLAITEFRADGPSGTSDEYVEICNVSDAAFTILHDTGETGVGLVLPGPVAAPVTGIGVYSFQQATNKIIKLFAIKDGVIFQPGQCFLGAGTSYSLGAYATPDVTFSNLLYGPSGSDDPQGTAAFNDGIPTDTGVAIFGIDQATFGVVSGLRAVCFTGGCAAPSNGNGPTGLATIEDAIGFNVVNTITFPGIAAPNSPIFREGTGLTPINATAVTPTPLSPVPNYAWVRRSCGVNGNGTKAATATLGTCSDPYAGANGTVGTLDKEGVIQDTDNNNNDFFGSETGANVATNSGGTVVRSGQPVAPNSTANRTNANPGPVTFSNFGGNIPGSSTPGPVVAIIGGPGPESFTGADGNSSLARSPRKRRFNSTVAVLNFGNAQTATNGSFDTSVSPFVGPNRERIFAVPRPGTRVDDPNTPIGSAQEAGVSVPADNNEASSPLGTFAFRVTLRNLTGNPITRLRWRLVDGTVDNRPVANEVFVAGQPMAVLRLISSTTARVFVGGGADQNCTYDLPASGNAGRTQCGGAGFKLSQGTILDPTQPQGATSGTGNSPATGGSGNCTGGNSLCNPGTANTVGGGAPIGGGINHSLNVENNTVAGGGGAGLFPSNPGTGGAGSSANSANPNRNQGVPRGTGTINLGNGGLAVGEQMSVEFRFGVQISGRFYLMIEPEGDNGLTNP